MSDWAEGLTYELPTAVDIQPAWTSGYDLPYGGPVDLAPSYPSGNAMAQAIPGTVGVLGAVNAVTGAVGNVARTILGVQQARDSYADAQANRALSRELKVLDAQTARDLAGINATTARVQAAGALNWARLQAQPSQFGLGTAANDRLVVLLTAVGVVIAALQYAKSGRGGK